MGIAAAVSAGVLGVAATPGQASTLAYVNVNDGNTYVASSTGSDVHEVATGVSSPSLSDTGNLYALSGTQVDVFAPGTGAQAPIPITGNPTQLAVSPFGGRLAWTDGTPISENTTVHLLTRSSGAVTSFTDAMGPNWLGPLRLTLSEFDINNPGSSASRVVLYNSLFTRPLWSNYQFGAPSETIVIQYAPNPAHTEAAAVVYLATLHSADFFLVVFPINTGLGPTGNPLTETSGSCEIGSGDVGVPPEGQTFAWAPNGSALAYSSAEGIQEVSVGAWNSNCSQIGAPQLVIPGGSEPSWGPSNRRSFPAPVAKP